MRNLKAGSELSELEALIHARRDAGATFVTLGRELNLSSSYVSGLYRVAAKKLAAQRVCDRGRRIDFLSRE